jgi:hypothetical protein
MQKKMKFIPTSTNSPTNILDIPDITIVIGMEIGQPATLPRSCANGTNVTSANKNKSFSAS